MSAWWWLKEIQFPPDPSPRTSELPASTSLFIISSCPLWWTGRRHPSYSPAVHLLKLLTFYGWVHVPINITCKLLSIICMILNGTIHIHIRDFVSGDGPEYENMSRLSSMCTVWKLLCVLMGSPPGPRTHFRTRSYFIALPLWFVRSGPELNKRTKQEKSFLKCHNILVCSC